MSKKTYNKILKKRIEKTKDMRNTEIGDKKKFKYIKKNLAFIALYITDKNSDGKLLSKSYIKKGIDALCTKESALFCMIYYLKKLKNHKRTKFMELFINSMDYFGTVEIDGKKISVTDLYNMNLKDGMKLSKEEVFIILYEFVEGLINKIRQ